MVYRRKGSGEPSRKEESSSISNTVLASESDEPPSRSSAERAPSGRMGFVRSSQQASLPKAGRLGTANAQRSERCSLCGHRAELVELPGRSEKYCFQCSADVATSFLLTTEIDAATLAGQDANPLIAEFAQLTTRLLARAQSA